MVVVTLSWCAPWTRCRVGITRDGHAPGADSSSRRSAAALVIAPKDVGRQDVVPRTIGPGDRTNRLRLIIFRIANPGRFVTTQSTSAWQVSLSICFSSAARMMIVLHRFSMCNARLACSRLRLILVVASCATTICVRSLVTMTMLRMPPSASTCMATFTGTNVPSAVNRCARTRLVTPRSSWSAEVILARSRSTKYVSRLEPVIECKNRTWSGGQSIGCSTRPCRRA